MRNQLQQSLEEGCRAGKRGLQFGAGYDVITAGGIGERRADGDSSCCLGCGPVCNVTSYGRDNKEGRLDIVVWNVNPCNTYSCMSLRYVRNPFSVYTWICTASFETQYYIQTN